MDMAKGGSQIRPFAFFPAGSLPGDIFTGCPAVQPAPGYSSARKGTFTSWGMVTAVAACRSSMPIALATERPDGP